MDTKLKADIAEYAVITEFLSRGYKVLKPIGDRLPYDLAIDAPGGLIKIQVKSAWRRKDVYIVDSRRTRTNRRIMRRAPYTENDFDYAVIYLDGHRVFFIIPVTEYLKYKSEITLLPEGSKEKTLRSCQFRSAWHLLF